MDKDNNNLEHMEEDIETLDHDDLDSVSTLQKTQRYIDIMQKVEDTLEKRPENLNQEIVLEDDLQLIYNALLIDIENEIVIIHNFIRDKYQFRFPELESVVHHPIEHARMVKKIGNSLIPSTSTASGKRLPDDVLQKIIDACDCVVALDSAKKKVVDFIESGIGFIAPNLCALVGSGMAAKLIGSAGGLSALAAMRGCDVPSLGAEKKTMGVFPYGGYLEEAETIQSTHPSLRMHACMALGSRATVAAHLDSTREDPTGKTGKDLLAQLQRKIDEQQTRRLPGVNSIHFAYLCKKKRDAGKLIMYNYRKHRFCTSLFVNAEVARRQEERKRSKRRWLSSSVGLSIAGGASFLSYSYIPHTTQCDDSAETSQ